MGRRSWLAILVYLALDLSNPFMEGAFCFDAEASVEITRHAREARPLGILPEASDPGSSVPPQRSFQGSTPLAPLRRPGPRRWLAERPQTFAPPDTGPPSALDEH